MRKYIYIALTILILLTMLSNVILFYKNKQLKAELNLSIKNTEILSSAIDNNKKELENLRKSESVSQELISDLFRNYNTIEETMKNSTQELNKLSSNSSIENSLNELIPESITNFLCKENNICLY